MCNIIKFDKNFKISEENKEIKYLFIFGKQCLYRSFTDDIEAYNELMELKRVYNNTKCFKSISNKDGTNERMYSLEVLP